jgi:5-methylcytosine-specific restriction endonuclease McrA
MQANKNTPHYVSANTRTTLEIDAHWFPIRILTADEAICSLMRERVIDPIKRTVSHSFSALDVNLNPCDWNSWFDSRAELVATNRYPLIRSAKHVIPVPTIILVKTHSQDPKLRLAPRGVPDIKEFLEAHDYTCAITGVRFDPKDFDPREIFNLDHIVPQHLGGPTDISNLVLASKDANTKKGGTWPYTKQDGSGQEIKPLKKLLTKPFPHLNLRGVRLRPEWNGLLFKASFSDVMKQKENTAT